jgi:ankyrin repeat protein
LLLTSGSDVNALDNRGCTALMAAASSGREDVLNLLLDSGANGKIVDGTGMDALATAMFHEQEISTKLHKRLSKDGRETPDSVFGK